METYRITIPEGKEALVDDPELPGRIQSYLQGFDLTIDGVSIERFMEGETEEEGRFVIPGPFVRIEADSDPTSHMADFIWDTPVDPDIETLESFVAMVSSDVRPSDDAILDVVGAMARITLAQQLRRT